MNEDVTTWALPVGAISRFGRGKVQDITFSPDGEHLVVGTRLGLWWYRLPNLTPLALWETGRGMISAVAFSDCGRWLATGNLDGVVKVWNVTKGVCETTIKQKRKLARLVFSPDGQHLAGSCLREALVYLWNPYTGEEIAEFKESNSRYPSPRHVIPVIFSPDGLLLAYANPDETHQACDRISVWHVNTGECIAHLRGHTAKVYALSFSPNGRLLASGDIKGTLREWDVTTEQPVRVFSEYAGKLIVIPNYTPSGRLRTAGVYKSTVVVWDVDSDKKIDAFEHRGNIDAIHFSNGTDLAVASSIDFKVWRLATPCSISSIVGHTRIPFSVKFSSDGHRLVSVGEGNATDWDIALKQPRPLRGAKANICDVFFTVDGNVRALCKKGNTATVCDIETHQIIAILDTPHEDITSGYFSVTGNLWACPIKGGNIYVWDGSGKETILRGHTDYIESIAFSPDDERMASVSRDQTSRVWDVKSGEQIISLSLSPPLHISSPASTPRLSPTVYNGDTNMIQSVLNGEKPRTRHTEIKAITFSPCGRFMAAGLEGGIRLWDARTYETNMVILLPREHRRQFALAFSPCGQYLASGAWWWQTEKVLIYLWCVASGENIATFWGHLTDIQSLAFSPDGSLLASGGFDGTILLWDMEPYLASV